MAKKACIVLKVGQNMYFDANVRFFAKNTKCAQFLYLIPLPCLTVDTFHTNLSSKQQIFAPKCQQNTPAAQMLVFFRQLKKWSPFFEKSKKMCPFFLKLFMGTFHGNRHFSIGNVDGNRNRNRHFSFFRSLETGIHLTLCEAWKPVNPLRCLDM